MKIGFYMHPHCRLVLVVMDFANWTDRILGAGFPALPAIERPATTPEIVAFEERETQFPAWLYSDFDELLDDEEKSGADRQHLESLLRILLRYPDRSVQPARTALPAN